MALPGAGSLGRVDGTRQARGDRDTRADAHTPRGTLNAEMHTDVGTLKDRPLQSSPEGSGRGQTGREPLFL